MKLLSAEMCRDGGSLCADFETEAGQLLSILLTVSHGAPAWHPYTHLQVGDVIQNEFDPSAIVKKGSPADEELKRRLGEWVDALPAAERERYTKGELRQSPSFRAFAALCDQPVRMHGPPGRISAARGWKISAAVTKAGLAPRKKSECQT